MAGLITDPNQLVVGTNLDVDLTLRWISIFPGGALNLEMQVAWSALRSKLALLWLSAPYASAPFPLHVSANGEYLIGFDGVSFNDWRFTNDLSRDFMAQAPWTEYNASGTLLRRYARLHAPAAPAEASWYWVTDDGTIHDINRPGPLDSGILVFDVTGLDYTGTAISLRCRDQGRTHGEFPFTGSAPLDAFFDASGVVSDTRITDPDSVIETASRYASIDLRFYATDQSRSVETSTGTQSQPFRVIVDAAGAPLDLVYQWLQWAARRRVNINAAGTPAWIGAAEPRLVISATRGHVLLGPGVFIDNLPSADWSRLLLQSHTGTACTLPWSPSAPDVERLRVLVADVHRIHGLDPAAPLQVSSSARTAGSITQTIADSGTTVTVTRAP